MPQSTTLPIDTLLSEVTLMSRCWAVTRDRDHRGGVWGVGLGLLVSLCLLPREPPHGLCVLCSAYVICLCQ